MLHWSNLRGYQVVKIWTAINNRRHGLFLGMGTGKTIITLTAIAILDALGMVSRVLVVAPKSVAQTVWHTQSAEWSHTRHLDFALCLGTASQREDALDEVATVTVINVENLLWLCDYYPIAQWPFDMVVLDESSLFKNNTSKRFKMLRKYTRTERPKRGGGLTPVDSPIKRLILLTGTPCSNGLKNLWSQSVLLDNGRALLRSFDAFTKLYFDASKYSRKLIPQADAAERIYTKIAPLVSVLRTKDVVDCQPVIYNNINVPLPDSVWPMYRELQKEFLIAMEDGSIVSAPTAATLRGKLHQFCNGAVYVGNPIDPDYKKEWVLVHDAKLDKLEEIIDSSDEPLLIPYWFNPDLERIKKRLGDKVTVFDKKNALQMERDWNAGEIHAMVSQYSWISHGMNLQKGPGCTIVAFSLLDDLEVHDQFVARLDRPGQKNLVTVNYLTCEGTVEGLIAKSLSDKSYTQQSFLKAMSTDLQADR